MFFRFELYPADLLNVLNGRTDEEAGKIIRQLVCALVGNNTECVEDPQARMLADKMIGRCKQKSDIYRANRMKKSEKPKPTPKKEAKPKQQKHSLFGFSLVNVTDKEEEALRGKFGAKLERMAEVLHNYKESSGKRYASDAGAIRSWVADKVLNEERRGTGFKANERKRDAQNASSMLTEEQRRFYGI
jgi:hypothetical protein